MRQLLIGLLVSVALSANALAQTAISDPAVTPAAPVPPASPTPLAPAADAATPADTTQQLQKLLGSKNSQQALAQAMVIGTLLGCTQKRAGKEATQAYYEEMQAVGKNAEAYCKQGNTPAARALLISTFEAKRNDVVTKAALYCYDTNAANFSMMGGQHMANDMAKFARWIRDPNFAKAEMTDQDVCHPKSN